MMVGFLSPELALAGRATGTETLHPTPAPSRAKPRCTVGYGEPRDSYGSLEAKRPYVAVGRRGRLLYDTPLLLAGMLEQLSAAWGWSRIPHPAFTFS